MRLKRIPTIRSRLTLLVMACIIPASLMAVALLWFDYHQDRARLIQDSTATARAIMSAVDRDMAGMQAALLALATSPHLASDDLAAFYGQAKEALKTQKTDNIVLLDSNGQQLLNTLRPFGSKLPSDTNPALLQVFKDGRPVTADLFWGPVRKEFVLVVAVPVYRGGTVVYALAAAVWPERLSGLLTREQLAGDRIGTILDSSGSIVARTNQTERLIGRRGAADLLAGMAQTAEGSVQTESAEGAAFLSVFSRSAISNWAVAIDISRQDLTGELVNGLWWLVACTAMLLLSSFAAAWAIASRIAASIHQLAAPALALGSGTAVSVPALDLKEADEVGRALTRASAMLMAAQHRANHDTLTGLANRALFDEIFTHQLAICRRTNRYLAIVYIDLDGFKPVNDTHGHAVGDEVLRMVAERLKRSIRESDLAARLGGDEFALVLVNTGQDAAQALALQLMDTLSAPYLVGSLKLEISASIGVACYPESGTVREALSLRADEAMYKAKAAGKRRYAVAS
jgi:diguanylate cyclase (GGDEF)-like protein